MWVRCKFAQLISATFFVRPSFCVEDMSQKSVIRGKNNICSIWTCHGYSLCLSDVYMFKEQKCFKKLVYVYLFFFLQLESTESFNYLKNWYIFFSRHNQNHILSIPRKYCTYALVIFSMN
jgi:hypothetical protein